MEVDEPDLCDLDSVGGFAGRFIASGRAIDPLINNAGIMACPETRVGPGWEAQTAAERAASHGIAEPSEAPGAADTVCHIHGAMTKPAARQGAGLRGAVVGDHAEHGRAFPARAATRACSETLRTIREGTPSACPSGTDPQVLSIALTCGRHGPGNLVAGACRCQHESGRGGDT
ncbi:hypothetical protein [Streptomyces lavendulae]|uniref:hypothetical protein n=1 Tax=Streptomyces lavendulae TaxID=1914 RepID=UPI003F4D6770